MGLKLIPLRANSKIPNTRNWKNNYFQNIEEVITWWKLYPDNNIGIMTGSIGDKHMVVIDIDLKHDGFDSLNKIPPLNRTMKISTCNGGEHYYFITSREYRNRQHLLPGLDIRGQGGYAVAPPSIIGAAYMVDNLDINYLDLGIEKCLFDTNQDMLETDKPLILYNKKKKGGAGGNQKTIQMNANLSRLIKLYPISNNRNSQQAKIIAKLFGQGLTSSKVFKLTSKWLYHYRNNFKTNYEDAIKLLRNSIKSCEAALNANHLTVHTSELEHIHNLKTIKTKPIRRTTSDRDRDFIKILIKQYVYQKTENFVKFTNLQFIEAFKVLFNKKIRPNQLKIMKSRYISTKYAKASREELLFETAKGIRVDGMCAPSIFEITGLKKYLE